MQLEVDALCQENKGTGVQNEGGSVLESNCQQDNDRRESYVVNPKTGFFDQKKTPNNFRNFSDTTKFD